MKNIYYLTYYASEDIPEDFSGLIKSQFNDFSLKNFNTIDLMDDDHLYFLSFKEAFKFIDFWGGDYMLAASIIEYSVSEDDLLLLAFNRKILANATQAWYYLWNETEEQIKEFSPILKNFFLRT